jgi:hypothetical protein
VHRHLGTNNSGSKPFLPPLLPAPMKKNKSTAPSRTQFRVLRQICNLIPAHRAKAGAGKNLEK